MISRSCIPTLDLSALLSFDPDEFIMFKLMGKLRTESAPEMKSLSNIVIEWLAR
jgi:hypothetical protein